MFLGRLEVISPIGGLGSCRRPKLGWVTPVCLGGKVVRARINVVTAEFRCSEISRSQSRAVIHRPGIHHFSLANLEFPSRAAFPSTTSCSSIISRRRDRIHIHEQHTHTCRPKLGHHLADDDTPRRTSFATRSRRGAFCAERCQQTWRTIPTEVSKLRARWQSNG